ncbi:hypothetical protein HMPREF1549_03162 [Actinomyces johnsonii F0510]|uniref:Uncharacterized protein n=1 Tax=Actinomyces johnsonii F0510 TaxID=1227262 RepID=U1RAF0_9ACTO|nr:hypothetical protein HMPREF1549_03162 [Actinomyces johnsonii F0510]
MMMAGRPCGAGAASLTTRLARAPARHLGKSSRCTGGDASPRSPPYGGLGQSRAPRKRSSA